jgi:hypothetical protein
MKMILKLFHQSVRFIIETRLLIAKALHSQQTADKFPFDTETRNETIAPSLDEK